MSDLPGLKEVLDAQCGVHQKLLALEEEKTLVLLAGDAGKLIPMLNDQQALLMQSKELEKQRNAICLGTEFKTLRELVESSGECRELLGPVFEELTVVVTTLKKKCALNKKLLETRLATIRYLLSQSGIDPAANTYTKNTSIKG